MDKAVKIKTLADIRKLVNQRKELVEQIETINDKLHPLYVKCKG